MAKRRKLQHQKGPQRPTARPQQKDQGPSKKPLQPAKKQHRQQHHDEPIIPFSPSDRILLVGEADLSFAASIIQHHGCTNVTATVLERDHAELVEKYPAVDTNIAVVNRRPDADAPPASPGHGAGSDAGHSEEEEPAQDYSDEDSQARRHKPVAITNKLIYNVDATKFPSSIARTPPRPNHLQLPPRRRQIHRRQPPGPLQPRAPRRLLPARPRLARRAPRRGWLHHRHPLRERALHPLEHPRPRPSRGAAARAQLSLPGGCVPGLPPREDVWRREEQKGGRRVLAGRARTGRRGAMCL
ncbi:uncharacterized protein TrAtP1_012722 [Trichoderma atroviride]|uniref:uncharacterized protein n=1 Tax=Hypocrea atroviridis TaxID=63577 RepID=UPI00331C13AF|nr:hypothetical protein TrAtP1_012722 [Trichoderma atroviride]